MRCSPWPSGDSSRTIARAGCIRLRTAAALRLRPSLRMPRSLDRNKTATRGACPWTRHQLCGRLNLGQTKLHGRLYADPRRKRRGPMFGIRRRDFIALLGGATVAWPLAARAQQAERMRRIGVLQGGSDRDDQRSQPSMAAFLQGLQQSGWTDGRNVRIDYRWPAGDADKARKYAAELVALAPDVILTASSISLAALLQTI